MIRKKPDRLACREVPNVRAEEKHQPLTLRSGKPGEPGGEFCLIHRDLDIEEVAQPRARAFERGGRDIDEMNTARRAMLKDQREFFSIARA